MGGITIRRPNYYIQAVSFRGQVKFRIGDHYQNFTGRQFGSVYVETYTRADPIISRADFWKGLMRCKYWHRWFGIGFDKTEVDIGKTIYWVYVPHYIFIAISGLLSLHATRRLKIQYIKNRIRKGLCGKCGYDLRATPDRCPECGTVPENVNITHEIPTTSTEANDKPAR